jgi:hypothetical protein
MLQENWEHYVLEHPTTLMDKELFRIATEIACKMYDFYNQAARRSVDVEEDTGGTTDGQVLKP